MLLRKVCYNVIMNKEEIINILNKYNFDNKKYIVISGAAMVIHGVKDKTDDIDIAVSEEYYEYLLNHYDCVFETVNKCNHIVYFIDNIINFGIDYFTKPEYIDNIPVQSLNDIIKLKEGLNRDKDKKDIELIRCYHESN